MSLYKTVSSKQYQPAPPVFTCSYCLQGGPALQVAQVAKPIKMMHKVKQKVSAPDGCPGHKPATTNQHGSCESCHWDTYCHWAAAGQLCSGDVCCRRGFVVNGDLFGVPVGSSQVRYSYILPVSVDISHKYRAMVHATYIRLLKIQCHIKAGKKPHLLLIYHVCQVVAL